ncbi:hypothetical protein [Enterobacter hormaechei]|uniref:hypothetical protein n=1 Tax=Enterobacter hormaechei TaxID=158836 RepID=UPI0039C096D7
MNKILGALALIVFAAAIYFGLRAFVSLFIVIPLSALFFVYGSQKFGSEIASVGVIAISLASIFWVNSITPLWGERYDARIQQEGLEKAVRIEKSEESRMIRNANDSIKRLLKDPASADFSDDYVSQNGSVCGYVNGKNSFGAYSGKERYAFVGGASYLDDNSKQFSELWSKNCKK